MGWIRDTSVKQKLVLSTMVPAAVAVILVAVIIGAYLRVQVRRDSAASLTAVARIIGSNSAAALTFGDRTDAETVLGALAARSSIVSAVIYDENDTIFATFRRDSPATGRPLPVRAPQEGFLFDGGELFLTQPIVIDGRHVGYTYLVSDLGELTALLRRIAIAEGVVILLALAVAFGLSSSLHRMILTPISTLAGAARMVSEREDYSVRIDVTGSDELGRLTTAFNDMLQKIERHDALLREKEAYFRSLIENSSDMITVIDVDGVVRYQSPSTELILGYCQEDRLGRPAVDLVHADDREAVERTLTGGFAEPGTSETFVARFLHKDGSWRVLESVRAVQVAEDGERIGVIHARDITERRRMEEERERLGAQLQQAQKMEAVGQLTGGVAHDFNNLLTVIIGNLELVVEGPAQPESHPRLIEGAIHAAERGAALTHRLLAFSRKQALRPQAIDVPGLVASMTELLGRTLGEIIRIETSIEDDVWRCVADRAQLENVLLNLALNARDATPRGGTLTIEASNVRLDDDYAATHADVAVGSYVRLTVSDDGVGMAPEVREKAFDPFFTTKGVGEGSGLGLSMVYGFIKQSGGHVAIYSEVGEGTSVHLYLPKAVDETTTADAEPASGEGPQGAGELILVVEDDDGVRGLTIEILGRLGYRTVAAGDAASALTKLEETVGISLLFTDVVLPGGVNGAELAKEAVRRRPGLSVLYTSGYTREAITRDGQLEPGVELLVKPFTKLELARQVHAALTRPPS